MVRGQQALSSVEWKWQGWAKRGEIAGVLRGKEQMLLVSVGWQAAEGERLELVEKQKQREVEGVCRRGWQT